MSNRQSRVALVFTAVIVAISAIGFVIFTRGPGTTEPELPGRQDLAEAKFEESAVNPDEGEVIILKPEEVPVEEYVYLPKGATLEAANESSAPYSDTFKSGNRRLRNIRQLVASDEKGGFISPRISPDGLQVMLTRPGYQGIYIAAMRNSEPVLISNLNAWSAKWTPEGRIEVRTPDGTIQVLGTDGTVEEILSADARDEPVYSKDDVIVTKQPDGSTRPITGNDDRFFGPRASQDGELVTYQGLNSGIYISRADGDGEPLHVGEGTNPVWLPNGSGVLFEVTDDDGHHVVSSDIYFADAEGTERTNLTEDFEGLGMTPSVGPDGSTVAFESDGGIYLGEIR